MLRPPGVATRGSPAVFKNGGASGAVLFSTVGVNGPLRCMRGSYTESLGEWSVYFFRGRLFKCGKVDTDVFQFTR